MLSLYSRQNMLDHLKNPRNKGKLENAEFEFKVVNRHCGDILYLYVQTEGDKISKINFDGDGCAVSMSSASLILENLQGAKIKDLAKISAKDVLLNFGEDLTPSRQNCALLILDGIEQLNNAIKSKHD